MATVAAFALNSFFHHREEGMSQTREMIAQQDTERIPDLAHYLSGQKATVKEFAAGEKITGPGEGRDRIICLISGRAEVVVGYRASGEVIVEGLDPGDVFGNLAFLTGRAWPKDAELVATEPSTVLEISLDRFQVILRENPEFTVSLLKSLGKKVVQGDRNEFAALVHVEGTDAAAVCAYPSHPGLPDEVQSQFQALALAGESVLIVGENGVGKDVLAYAIFGAAITHNEVLVPVDVRRMRREIGFLRTRSHSGNDTWHEATEEMQFFFGRETRGENGAIKTLPGYLDLANNGTLFIRGAEHLKAVTQQKLVDALKTGVYCPVGSSQVMKADFRLICTTEIIPDQFTLYRHPLMYELKDSSLFVPPLRDRQDQLLPLARRYLAHYAREMNKKVPTLSELTVKAMTDYSWPGNDLELANTMRRAVMVCPDDLIRRQDLMFDSRRPEGRARYNLLRIKPIRQALLSPLFPAILQSAFVPLFVATVLLLFLGPADPSKNLASVVMWALAWPGLIVAAFFGARISCSICAIGALSTLAKRIVSLEIPFPEILKKRSDFLIAGGILFLIWMESATDMRNHPFYLGLLLLVMFVLAFVMNTLYARQSWCRYLCPLGGMTGLLARTSLVELRAQREICLSRCNSPTCYFGTSKAEGCSFGQVVATLHSNHFCKICASCVKNCKLDAIMLNVRIPGDELGEVRHVRTGTGFLVLGLCGALITDLFLRTPHYEHLVSWLAWPQVATFTFSYLGVILGVNLLSLGATALSRRTFRERFLENYSRFALSLLPLAAMGLLAFHLHYFFTVGAKAPGLIGQYFGIASLEGSNPVMPTAGSLLVQHLLIVTGLGWSLITMCRLGRWSRNARVFAVPLGVLPHALVACLLALAITVLLRMAFS